MSDLTILENETLSPENSSDLINVSETETVAQVPPAAETAAQVPPAAEIPAPQEANKTYVNSGIADIVFLIDATGSMKPCIEALYNNINMFLDMLVSTEGNGSPVTDWRARVVGYRDYNADGSTSYGWLVDNVFTRDVTTLRNQLANLTPKGGGDIPESLLDAMMTVATAGSIDLQATEDEENSNKWRPQGSAARVVIVFTDATFHPTMSLPGYEGAGIKDLYNVYRQERIKPYFFVPDDSSYGQLSRFRGAILEKCGSGSDGLLSVTSDRTKFNKLLLKLAEGVSKSSAAAERQQL